MPVPERRASCRSRLRSLCPARLSLLPPMVNVVFAPCPPFWITMLPLTVSPKRCCSPLPKTTCAGVATSTVAAPCVPWAGVSASVSDKPVVTAVKPLTPATVDCTKIPPLAASSEAETVNPALVPTSVLIAKNQVRQRIALHIDRSLLPAAYVVAPAFPIVNVSVSPPSVTIREPLKVPAAESLICRRPSAPPRRTHVALPGFPTLDS